MNTNIGDIEVINMSLARVGRPLINSLDDETEEAGAVRACFPILKKELIASLNWSFFADVEKLVLSPRTEEEEDYISFEYKYSLPENFMKFESILEKKDGDINYIDDETTYTIIGSYIFTNIKNAGVKFISSKPSSGYSSGFAIALASKLAEWLNPSFGDPSADSQQLAIAQSQLADKSARSRNARNKTNQYKKTLRPYGMR